MRVIGYFKAATERTLAAVLVLLGALATESTQLTRWGGGKTPYAAKLITAGANTVITPTAGKAIELFWVSVIPAADNAGANLVTVAFTGGVTPYMVYAVAHWERFTGPVDAPVVVTLTNAMPVAVTIHYREV